MKLIRFNLLQQRTCPCLLSLLLVFLFPVHAISQTHIVVGFGDSLTEGCGVEQDTCGWKHGSDGYGYEEHLQYLLNQGGGNEFVVNNFGRGGEQVWEGLDRIDSVLNSACNQGSNYFLLLEGTNDLLHGADGQNVKFNLGVMIDKSRRHGIEPLLATIPPDPNPEHEYKDIPLMNDFIRELALEKDVVLVDLYNELHPNWDIYTNPRGCYNDVLHPNSTGFAAIGSVWFEHLVDMPVQTTGGVAYAKSAVVYGSVDDTVRSDSDFFIQYGKNCVLSESVPAVIVATGNSGKKTVRASLSGLDPETGYCYRLISLKNGVFMHSGATLSFSTSYPSVSWLQLLLRTP